jgi:uncharacterized protein (DUF433 family)
MASESANLLTPAEAAAIADVPLKAVYKAVAERLPRAVLIRRSGQTFLKPAALLSIRLDYELPKEVPIKVRRFVYSKVEQGRPARVEYGTKLFSYVVDPRAAAATVARRMKRYRKAMRLIVEDPQIQGGAATFRGTRLLVHQIAGLVEQGIPERELRQDYPHLTPEMIDAARLFAQAHPRRGRPRKPTWRSSKPLESELLQRRSA